MSELYVVTGATGHTGQIVAERLVTAGKKVRVVGRDAAKLKKITGAEAAVGSLEDFDFVAKAFAGASAAYVLVPPNYALPQGGFRAYQNRIIQSAINALDKSRTSHVVTLSSVGAHLGAGVGPVCGLYDMEKAFTAYLPKANVLHLRPTYFMENLLANIGMVKSMGILGTPLAADVAMPFIASRDIGAVAAKHLLELDFKGHSVQELLGARDVTMNEVARALGTAIGKPDLKYVAVPYDDAKLGLLQMGLSEEIAGMYVELSRAFNDGTRPTQSRSPSTTTPTTIEEFAKSVFAPAYGVSA